MKKIVLSALVIAGLLAWGCSQDGQEKSNALEEDQGLIGDQAYEEEGEDGLQDYGAYEAWLGHHTQQAYIDKETLVSLEAGLSYGEIIKALGKTQDVGATLQVASYSLESGGSFLIPVADMNARCPWSGEGLLQRTFNSEGYFYKGIGDLVLEEMNPSFNIYNPIATVTIEAVEALHAKASIEEITEKLGPSLYTSSQYDGGRLIYMLARGGHVSYYNGGQDQGVYRSLKPNHPLTDYDPYNVLEAYRALVSSDYDIRELSKDDLDQVVEGMTYGEVFSVLGTTQLVNRQGGSSYGDWLQMGHYILDSGEDFYIPFYDHDVICGASGQELLNRSLSLTHDTNNDQTRLVDDSLPLDALRVEVDIKAMVLEDRGHAFGEDVLKQDKVQAQGLIKSTGEGTLTYAYDLTLDTSDRMYFPVLVGDDQLVYWQKSLRPNVFDICTRDLRTDAVKLVYSLTYDSDDLWQDFTPLILANESLIAYSYDQNLLVYSIEDQALVKHMAYSQTIENITLSSQGDKIAYVDYNYLTGTKLYVSDLEMKVGQVICETSFDLEDETSSVAISMPTFSDTDNNLLIYNINGYEWPICEVVYDFEAQDHLVVSQNDFANLWRQGHLVTVDHDAYYRRGIDLIQQVFDESLKAYSLKDPMYFSRDTSGDPRSIVGLSSDMYPVLLDIKTGEKFFVEGLPYHGEKTFSESRETVLLYDSTYKLYRLKD